MSGGNGQEVINVQLNNLVMGSYIGEQSPQVSVQKQKRLYETDSSSNSQQNQQESSTQRINKLVQESLNLLNFQTQNNARTPSRRISIQGKNSLQQKLPILMEDTSQKTLQVPAHNSIFITPNKVADQAHKISYQNQFNAQNEENLIIEDYCLNEEEKKELPTISGGVDFQTFNQTHRFNNSITSDTQVTIINDLNATQNNLIEHVDNVERLQSITQLTQDMTGMTLITKNDQLMDDDHLDRKFAINQDEAMQQKVQSDWKQKDYKGNKKNLFIRKVQQSNEKVIALREKFPLERIEAYVDSWPCLSLRKCIMRFRVYVNYVAKLIISHKIFEFITIIVIVANSLKIAMEDPTHHEETAFSIIIENLFLSLYTLEMLLKILGLGFIWNKGSYLRDPWNILDFVIVSLAYVQIILQPESSSLESLKIIKKHDDSQGSSVSLGGLRAFRVLRPLRTIQRIEGLKVLVTALLTAMPLLRDTIIILLFFFMIFAVAGLQLLSGLLKQRCVNIYTGVNHKEDMMCGGLVQCPPGYFCGKQNKNPNQDATNFDTIFFGMLTVFQAVTLEGWTGVMVMVQDVWGYFSLVMFIPMVFIGAFFLLNLTLAVLNSKVMESQKLHLQTKKKLALLMAQPGNNQHLNSEGDLVDEMSIREFLVAKWVVKRMKEYVHKIKVQRAKMQEELAEQIRIGEELARNKVMPFGKKKKKKGKAKKTNDYPNMYPIQIESQTVIIAIQDLDEGKQKNDIITSEIQQINEIGKLESQENLILGRKYSSGSVSNFGADMSGISREMMPSQLSNIHNEFEETKNFDHSQLGLSYREFNHQSDVTNNQFEQTGDLPKSRDVEIQTDNNFGAQLKSRYQWTAEKLDDDNEEFEIEKKQKDGEPGFQGLDFREPKNKKPGPSKKVDGERTLFRQKLFGEGPQAMIKMLVWGLQKKIHHEVLREPNKTVTIAKGMEFKSSSENEILEKRSIAQQTAELSSKNKICIPYSTESIRKEDRFVKRQESVRPSGQPFQLMNQYEIQSDDENQDEIELTDERSQPYYTVTSIGQPQIQDAIGTKQITRRSDVIVTSTLSIKIEPKEKKHAQLLLSMNNLELQEYIYQKNLDQARKLIPKKRSSSQKVSPAKSLSSPVKETRKSSVMRNEMKPSSYFSDISRVGKLALEETLKSKSLLSKSANKTIYSMSTRKKHDVFTSMNEASIAMLQPEMVYQQVPVISRKCRDKMNKGAVFSIEDAKEIFDGRFYEDDSPASTSTNALNIRKDNEIKLLKEFEKQKEKLKEEDVPQSNDIEYLQMKKQLVPKELKEEFFLPNEGDYLVDQYQVRIYDAQKNKKWHVWSGQEILGQLIDENDSHWVTNQLNNIRVWPKGPKRYYKQFRTFVKKIVNSSFFENFMILSVVVNTVVLGMDRFDIDKQTESVLGFMNSVFTYIFIIELSMKLIAVGPSRYLSDKMNYMDGGVVLMSIVELVINSLNTNSSGGGSSLSAFRTIRIFRTFRVLRVARLLRALDSMQVIIAVIQRSIMQFVYISILMILFIFIFALLGMQFFGGQFNFEDGVPRSNFDTFNNAFVTSFQIMSMESWPPIMYNAMRSDAGQIVSGIYFVLWIFIGNFILLNLFIAILLDSFVETEGDKETENAKQQSEAEQKKKRIEKRKKKAKPKKDKKNKGPPKPAKKKKEGVQEMFSENQEFEEDQKDEEKELDDLDENEVYEILATHGLIDGRKNNELDIKAMYKGVRCMESLYLFHKKSKFRQICARISKHRYFERTILVLIVLSSCKLAFDTYIMDYPPTNIITRWSDNIDVIFNLCFLIESILKAVHLGLFQDQGSYLRESWNMMDFFIVFTSMIDLILSSVDLPFIKILRLLRTLRPLRFISHNISMKLVIVALFESIGGIFNVIVVVLIVWLMFAILGVNLFSGKFQYCSEQPYKLRTLEECVQARAEWLTFDSNFDNVGSAMLTLFIVASQENWPDIMHQAIDSAGEREGPRQDSTPAAAYFFIAFMMIGSYFFLNFFIGVLFLKYKQAQDDELKGFSKQDLHWMDIQRMIVDASPDYETTNVPKIGWRRRIHGLVGSNKFDIFIMLCIIGNMGQMAVQYEGCSEIYINKLEKVNLVFTTIFLVECILKLFAYGRTFFRNAWNNFDFIVVFSSLLDIIIGLMDAGNLSFLRIGPQIGRVMRVLRVSRVIRLIGKNKGLSALIDTIIFSLPSLMNVLGLLFLILFMFAILGSFFFRNITKGVIISPEMNFKNFGNSMLMVFRMTTGEDWNNIMFDCMRTEEDCNMSGTCGTPYAAAYYVLFILISTYIMLNLFVLVILQQFDKYYLPKDNVLERFKNDFENFKETWKEFTLARYNCLKIKESQIPSFLRRLPSPLGMPSLDDGDLKRGMLKMGIKSDEGYVYFNELLYRAMRRVYGNFKLGKQMQIFELKSQYKIFFLTMAVSKKSRVQQTSDVFSLIVGKAQSVNPFLTVMFLNMSFNIWINIATRCLERRIARKVERDRLKLQQQVDMVSQKSGEEEEEEEEDEEEDMDEIFNIEEQQREMINVDYEVDDFILVTDDEWEEEQQEAKDEEEEYEEYDQEEDEESGSQSENKSNN